MHTILQTGNWGFSIYCEYNSFILSLYEEAYEWQSKVIQ